MKVLNFNEHNAENLANKMISAYDEFIEAGSDEMELGDKLKLAVERWSKLNPEPQASAEGRMVLKHLYTALAYMGVPYSNFHLETLASREMREAQRRGDKEAAERAREEIDFWLTVAFKINESEPGIHLAYALIKGYGCDKDLERAKPIYAKVLFDKYESLDEGQRSKLCDARDGKLGCPMPELRGRVVDSLVKGDREMFDKIYDEAMAKDEVEAVDSVHSLMCYIESVR